MTEHETVNVKKHMPLEGIRVVEYGLFHAGPGASSILGELGAEVIKIESENGDPSRTWDSVGNLDFCQSKGPGLSYQISNRNKKGICLDIKHEKGKEVFQRLIEGSDVFITNIRKSTKVHLGIDYATLSGWAPRIIYASVSGYGPEGPDSDLGAYDPLGQARSGLMYVHGLEEPSVLNLAFLDQATAIILSHGILTALLERALKGYGQEVHISLYSAALWLMYPNMVMAGTVAKDPNCGWNRMDNSPLRNRFLCKGGKWIMSAHHPEAKFWATFCEVTGQKHLIDDPRFVDDAARRANCKELVGIFDGVFATRTCEDWLKILLPHGLLFAPVQRNLDVINDPQAVINNYVVDFDHPYMGKVKMPGYPIHFSKSWAGLRSIGPNLGEHTDRVMELIGYASQEIEALKKEGVIR